MVQNDFEQKEKYKIPVIATLLGISCVLTYYFHAILDTGKFFRVYEV